MAGCSRKINYVCKYNEGWLNIKYNFDLDKIMNDVFTKCYNPFPKYYIPKYCEIYTGSRGGIDKLINLKEYKLYELSDIDICKTEDFIVMTPHIDLNVDINLINLIMKNYVKNSEFTNKFCQLIKNIFTAKNTIKFIIHDCEYISLNVFRLTDWLQDFCMTKLYNDQICIHASSYYDKDMECYKQIKENVTRVIIIDMDYIQKHNITNKKCYDIIEEFVSMGVMNFIVINKLNINYDIENVNKYIQNNEDLIKSSFSNLGKYNEYHKNDKIIRVYDLLSRGYMLLSHMLKWLLCGN